VQIVLDARTVLKQLGLDENRYEQLTVKDKQCGGIAIAQAISVMTEQWVGKTVGHDVISRTGLLLIPARTVLTRGHLHLLGQHGIQHANLLFVSPEQQSAAASMIQEATRYTEDLFYRVRTNRKIPMLEIRSQLIPLVQRIAEHPDLFHILESLKAKDSYTYKHSVGVGVLATFIGKWLDLDPAELALLTTAATLHDVGNMRISQELLQKTEKLTDAEFDEVKRHTIYGYEMLKETPELNERIAVVALQHHERIDGSGYPLQLNDAQIDRLSKIVAVADMFHAMTSSRSYQRAFPFYEVVERMRKNAHTGLDPLIVNVFLENMNRRIIGKDVLLSDGRRGKVVFQNPNDRFKPLIRINQSFVDLSKERDIHIRDIIA
jgi:HD-GYP domain-containing protein (c-di-GMP phosphodiesterase class II)